MIEFEWNFEKADINKKKHGISFEEAKSVFDDFHSYIFDDELHSLLEYRFIIIGYSRFNKIITVSYTERQNKIRLISARLSTKNERKIYERNNQKY